MVHADRSAPGLRRQGKTRPRYVTDDGDPVTAEDRRRIDAMVIPPAWTDVWICADPRGHIQATGRDAAGRTQYLYHPEWTAHQAEVKFEALPGFGHCLGVLRRAVDKDLDRTGMPHDKVTALVVALMDRTLVRVGNDRYAIANKSYGLTTLRSRHVKVQGATVDLKFVGKSGKALRISTTDRRLARLVKRCQELPGQSLFSWKDATSVGTVTSTDVNEYIRQHTDGDASAKTFRTWGASVMAASLLAEIDPPSKRSSNTALRQVGEQLGNTLSVCRESYVHPRVLTGFFDGSLRRYWNEGPRRSAGGLLADERRLLHFIESA